MIFKDRIEAGQKLAEVLAKDKDVLKEKKNLIVLSIVRGGAVVGFEIAKKLHISHFPLVVKKIGVPYNEELAIGALCYSEYFLDKKLIGKLNLKKEEIKEQIDKAKEKQQDYLKKFVVNKFNAAGKVVIMVDDGIATGSSVLAALKYLKKNKVKKIILASPVAPTDFKSQGFDKIFILHKDDYFNAVSQFYQQFDQLTDDQVRQIFSAAGLPLAGRTLKTSF